MDFYRIIETDNYGGDYPNEKFAMPYTFRKPQADAMCAHINSVMNPSGQGARHWCVVPDGYELQPGFEP